MPAEPSIDQLLAPLIAVNGTLNTTSQEDKQPPTEPLSSSLRESNITSSASSPTSESTGSSESDSDDSTSDQSTVSTASDQQLHLPINYNETLLKKLHGYPQIRTFNTMSVQLPGTSTNSEEDMDTTQTNHMNS